MRRKLQQKGFTLEIINETIDELKKKNFLSNNRFIENYIQARSAKGYGPLRIQMELTARGISSDEIEIHLKSNEESWFAHCKYAWKKKFKNILPRTTKDRAQQMRFLQYRGFTNDQIEFILQSDTEHA